MQCRSGGGQRGAARRFSAADAALAPLETRRSLNDLLWRRSEVADVVRFHWLQSLSLVIALPNL